MWFNYRLAINIFISYPQSIKTYPHSYPQNVHNSHFNPKITPFQVHILHFTLKNLPKIGIVHHFNIKSDKF